ncbi:MAG: ExbD/TolR family protein [Nitrospinota bacterium]
MMKIEKFAAEVNQRSNSEINTLPVLSLLMILIPFLLLTTVFVETTVFDLHLPVKGRAGGTEKVLSEKSPGLFVYIDEKGLRTGVNHRVSSYFDVKDLPGAIGRLKKRYSTRSDITLVSSPGIQYQKIIDILTVTASNGFGQISISDDRAVFENMAMGKQDS